jgi:hypothetical protein
MSKLNYLKLDFEKNLEDQQADIKVSLDRDFSNHTALLALQAGESSAKLTKQLNDLQFINEEKIVKLRSLGKELGRTEAGLLAMGSSNPSGDFCEKTKDLKAELKEVKEAKQHEDLNTDQLMEMSKTLKAQIMKHKRAYQQLQDKFKGVDKHSDDIETSKQAAFNLLHEAGFQFTQSKQQLLDLSRQRRELIQLKRTDFQVLTDENSALTERLTSLTITARTKNKQKLKSLRTLKTTVDENIVRKSQQKELKATLGRFKDAFTVIKAAVQGFDPSVVWDDDAIPHLHISRILNTLQKKSDSLQLAYFSMAEGRQDLITQFHKLSIQLKAESQKDLIDDIRGQEEALMEKVSRLTESAPTCNQGLTSVDDSKAFTSYTVEAAEKLVMQLFSSFVSVLFRFLCSVAHIDKWALLSQLQDIRQCGKTTLAEMVGIVMSDIESNIPDKGLVVIRANSQLKQVPTMSALDLKHLQEHLLTVLENPQQASALAALVTSAPFLKSFFVRRDVVLLKSRCIQSVDLLVQEAVSLVHIRLKDKYRAGVNGFLQVIQDFEALHLAEARAFEELDVPRQVKTRAMLSLDIQSKVSPRVLEHASVTRLAMAFSMEKHKQFLTTNERMKRDFENYVTKYRVITHKLQAKDTPLKKHQSHVSLVSTPIDPVCFSAVSGSEGGRSGTNRREEMRIDKVKSKSTGKLPKFKPERSSKEKELAEARNLRVDLDQIRRKEREVKQDLAKSKTLRTPRRLEPLSSRLL